MNWSKHIQTEELEQIAETIKTIEAKTDAEIITVIANKSSTTKHVKYLLYLIVITFVHLVFSTLDYYFLIEPDAFLMALTYLLAIPLSFLLSHYNFIQRLLTPKCDQKFQAESQAEREFYVQRLYMTKNKTGLLIYVSLLEKQVIVLADEKITEKLPKDSWQGMIQLIIKGIKNKSLKDGLVDALENISTKLFENFPNEEQNPNELPNHVILRTMT